MTLTSLFSTSNDERSLRESQVDKVRKFQEKWKVLNRHLTNKDIQPFNKYVKQHSSVISEIQIQSPYIIIIQTPEIKNQKTQVVDPDEK